MNGRVSACRLGGLLAVILLVACQQPSAEGTTLAPEPSTDLVGNVGGETSRVEAAEEVPGPSEGIDGDEDKPPEADAAPRADRLSDPIPAAPQMTATERVGYAFYVAQLAMVDTLLVESQRAVVPTVVEGTSLRVIFGSNIFGELQDCGCRRNPMGGLARRSALVAGELSETSSPIFHLDTGNALVRDPFPGEERVESYRLGAEAILQAYGEMQIDAMAVGVLDIAFGGAELAEWSRLWGVPLVSANWSLPDGPLASGRMAIERSGVTLGVAAVSALQGPTNTFFHDVGVTVREASLVGRSIEGLRADGVDAVVLMVTGGVEQASTVLAELAPRGTLPDIVLVSGSRQLMQEPLWVQGVPIVEAPDRGRQLGVLDLTMVDGALQFARPVAASTQRLLDLRTTLHARQQTTQRLAAAVASDAPENRVRTLQTILSRQIGQLGTLSGPIQSDTDNAGAMNQLSFSLAPVALTLDEERDVAAIVERAVARGWTPPHGAH